ncbi:MAG: eukaryotic translation initiation factor 4G [Terrestrivirus sp.]|uniref:Eukaryotic translation initiation factor 4G n=1 Tax=Terrestrivirus sp. TaxID=2487775 RepID=A0A3G4ZS81_9VIRU|nr:MAG: eukaryotic translation initiation factor 4G [Terrestrivirus sp.]
MTDTLSCSDQSRSTPNFTNINFKGANENQEGYIYSIDTFVKYREANKGSHETFEKYYVDSLNNFKFKRSDFLDRQDIKMKLNYILTKRNVSNEDEELYKCLMKTLNKVNNNMLPKNNSNNEEGKSKENSLQATIDVLTNIKYTKVEHFQKLAELMVEKALAEPTFCSLYAVLCFELSRYYIEDGNSKKIYFRHILLNICQTTFESFLNNCENIDRTKLIGLMKFLGELYTRGLLPAVIIKGCFDRMGLIIEKVQNTSEGISELVVTTYKSLYDESKKINSPVASHIKNKLNAFIDNGKLPLKSKFALQNALEHIDEIEKRN